MSARSSAELIPEIQAVLARHVPDAAKHDHHRFAESIVMRYLIALIGQRSNSRRGTAPALKRLAALQKKISSVARHIEALGMDERLALHDMRGPSQFEMLSDLSALNEHVVAAHRLLSEQPPVPTPKGRPPEVVADQVTARAGHAFKCLTNKAPARSTDIDDQPAGKFDAFLTDIFSALGIEANVDHQAREFLKRIAAMEKRP
jgi:hypothetical protein